MEDAPRLECGLGEHLALDLAFQVARVRLNVDRLRSPTRACAHLELARSVLEALQLLWILVELEMPQLLLLLALLVGLEVRHQVLDLLDLGIGVGVHDLRKILHEAEVGAHGISQARQLAQLGDKGYLVSRAAVLVDEQWLIHVADVLVVASPVVLLVAGGSPVLVEGGAGTLREINPIDLVGLLVVSGDHGAASECLLDRFLAILTALLGLVSQVVEVAQAIVCPDHLEADVDVEKDA